MSEHIHARWGDSKKESSALAQTCLVHKKGKPSPCLGPKECAVLTWAEHRQRERGKSGSKDTAGGGGGGREAMKIRSG